MIVIIIYISKEIYIMHNNVLLFYLNKTGSQNMISNTGNVLVYNGEIYDRD